MNEIMIFDTEADALAFCAKCDAILGYPDGKGTERYTMPEEGGDGKWYVPTNQFCPAGEKAKIAAERKILPAEVKRDTSEDSKGMITEVKGVKLSRGKIGGKLG